MDTFICIIRYVLHIELIFTNNHDSLQNTSIPLQAITLITVIIITVVRVIICYSIQSRGAELYKYVSTHIY